MIYKKVVQITWGHLTEVLHNFMYFILDRERGTWSFQGKFMISGWDDIFLIFMCVRHRNWKKKSLNPGWGSWILDEGV